MQNQMKMNPEPLAGFNAVAESRKWKEAVARETEGMSMEERIAYFRRHSSVAAIRHAGAGGSAQIEEPACVMREEPPTPERP